MYGSLAVLWNAALPFAHAFQRLRVKFQHAPPKHGEDQILLRMRCDGVSGVLQSRRCFFLSTGKIKPSQPAGCVGRSPAIGDESRFTICTENCNQLRRELTAAFCVPRGW